MTIFDPFADVTRLRQQIDRLFEQQGQAAKQPDSARVFRPAVDVVEDEEAITVRVDLPDVARESLDVQLQEDELIIRAERKFVAPEKGTLVHSERPYGQFHRAFRLGIPVQHERVEASYREGVLTVRLPKAEAVKPRRIAVLTDGA